ncbi:MAG: hypothetical protein PHU25_06370 [Deltaproteobacteria bacterium]|nr:hypothetical protein [Deltaproteobacteria bacterium]
MRLTLMMCAAMIALFGTVARVEAGEQVKCELLTIEASSGGQGIDAALAAHAAILRKPPFSAFNTFRLLKRQDYDLTPLTPVVLTLPQALGGSLLYNRMEEGRFNLTLTINRQGGAPVIINTKASPGRPFFAAGFETGTGTLIFGVICNRSGTVEL